MDIICVESWYLNIRIKNKMDINNLSVISYELKEDGYLLSISYLIWAFLRALNMFIHG